jgi:hypothetical protein
MLKEEALDRILWRTGCGSVHGPVVRQATAVDVQVHIVRQATAGGDVQVHINLVVCSFCFTNHFQSIINTAISVHYGTIKTLCGNSTV